MGTQSFSKENYLGHQLNSSQGQNFFIGYSVGARIYTEESPVYPIINTSNFLQMGYFYYFYDFY